MLHRVARTRISSILNPHPSTLIPPSIQIPRPPKAAATALRNARPVRATTKFALPPEGNSHLLVAMNSRSTRDDLIARFGNFGQSQAFRFIRKLDEGAGIE